MAKEEQQNLEEEVTIEKSKSSFLKIIIIAVIALIVIGAGGGGTWYWLKSKKEAEKMVQEADTETPEQTQKTAFAWTMEFVKDNAIATNLNDPGVTKLIQFEFTLEFDTDKVQKEAENKKAKILDSVAGLLNTKTENDIRQDNGRQTLKEEIKNRINSFIHTGKVVDVYCKYIIQSL